MKSEKGGPAVGIFLTLFSLVFAGVGIGLTVRDTVTWATWPAADARVLSKADPAEDGSTRLAYEYEVGGRLYRGEVHAKSPSEIAARRAHTLSEGQSLRIFYDPASPEKSVTACDLTAQPLALTLFIIPFLWLGLCLVWPKISGRELMTMRPASGGATPTPGGGAFLLLVGFGLAGAVGFAIAINGIPLLWPMDLYLGLGILAGIVGGYGAIASRLEHRRRAREAVQRGTTPHLPTVGNRLGLALFGTLFWCSIVGVFVGAAISSFWNNWAAQTWYQTAPGTVTASRTEVSSSGGRTASTTSRPVIVYRYDVGGKKYVSQRYSAFSVSQAGKVVDEHPPGTPVTVYYDPANPAQAVLTTEVPDMAYVMILFIQPFVLIGLWMATMTVNIPGKLRPLPALFATDVKLPLVVPGWGTVRQTPEGLAIAPRRPPLRGALVRGLIAYALLSVLGVCLVLGPSMLLGLTSMTLVRAVFIATVVLAAAVAAYRLIKGPGKTALRIDAASRTVTVERSGQSESFSFDQVRSWRIRTVPYQYRLVFGNNIQYVVIEAALDDKRTVPVHAFRGISDTEVTGPVAHRMADLLAAWTGGESRKQEVKSGASGPACSRPLALILGPWAALRGEPEYEDLT